GTRWRPTRGATPWYPRDRSSLCARSERGSISWEASIGIWELLQNRAGDRLDDRARCRRLAETSGGTCLVLLSSEAWRPRNVKVIRLRPLFLLPTGRGEDFPVALQTSS